MELSLSHLPVSISLLSNLSSRPLPLPSYVVFSIAAPAFTFPFVSFMRGMGRRRTAEDYQRTAEENGWDLETHEEEGSQQQTKGEPSDRYKQNQQEAPNLQTGLAQRLQASFLPRNVDFKR